jgi:hypothetical protein
MRQLGNLRLFRYLSLIGLGIGLLNTGEAIAQAVPDEAQNEYQCPRYFLESTEPRIVIYVLQGTPEGDAIATDALAGEILTKVNQQWPDAFLCERYNRATESSEFSIQVATVANLRDRDRVIAALREVLVNVAGVTIHSHGNAASAEVDAAE